MRGALQTIRAFRLDCWLAIACLAIGWLLIQDVTGGGEFNANSNVVLMALVGWFGWQAYDRLFLMRIGPYPVLTPGLERSATLACLVLVGSVALVGAVLCWWHGNRNPALGPSVLLAAVTMTGVHRLYAARHVKWLMQFGVFVVVWMAVAGNEHLRAVATYAEWLSNPWLQLGSLVVAALACALRKPVRNRAFLPLLFAPTRSERPFHTVCGGLRNAAAAMRVFGPDGGNLFAFVAIACGSFLLASMFTAFGSHPANANVVVLWLLAAVGGIVGYRVAQACLFDGFLLVEGFARSVTLASYGIVAIASAIGASLSLTVGNWVPPIAPGVFIALVMIQHHRFTQLVTSLGALFMVCAAVWRGSDLDRFAEFTWALSHPWMQFAALVATIPVVGNLRMTVRLPVVHGGRSTVTSQDLPLRPTVIRNIAMSARGLVCMLLLALLLWVLHPEPPGFVFRLIALGWLIMVMSPLTESDIVSRMARDWTLGVTDLRLALGRRCVAFDVLCVISWVPAGMVGVLIHGTLLDVQGNTLVVILLLGLIAAFAVTTLRCWTLGRLSDRWQLAVEVLAVHLLLAGAFVLDMAEYGALDHALLVLAGVAAAALAVEAGGRGLARAKLLTLPVD